MLEQGIKFHLEKKTVSYTSDATFINMWSSKLSRKLQILLWK